MVIEQQPPAQAWPLQAWALEGRLVLGWLESADMFLDRAWFQGIALRC